MEPENQEKEIEMEQEPIKVYKGGAVNSVNGKTGDVVLTTSDLENDSDYQTGSEVDSAIDSAIGELNIPTKTSDIENDGEDGSSVYIEADELASVATSGSYNDLENKPTIPAAQVNSDWNADSGVAQILNKPTIPTVNDATLTITQNGTSKGTFTANDADDTTIEVSDTTYTAGTGIDITNGVISATGGGGPTVVQTTGTSQTDVMSQNATTSIVFANPGTNEKVRIGNTGSVGDGSMAVGKNAIANNSYGTSIGDYTKANKIGGTAIGYGVETTGTYGLGLGYGAKANNHSYSVALGSYSSTSRAGEVNIGTGSRNYGYNSTTYRILGGVHDPVDAHDAATKGYVDSSVISGAGAPTTSTVGTVGQLYEDTTNGKLYQCTAVSGSTYTWSEVGAGGGGGVTPVQTTGTSTTDVMSQNATSSMVFADPGTDSKVKIGTGASARSDLSIAIGASATDSGAYYNTVIGGNSVIATGRSACVGVGFQTSVNAENSVAIGRQAKIQQTSSQNSVALGSWAEATRKGEVNVGNTANQGYNNTAYRVIGGVHDGQLANDCATVNQVNSLIDAINTALSTNIPHIGA